MTRRETPVRGLVLAGGGARGSYQVGVWQALQEMGWEPGVIAGTSVGCLNGAMFALGLTDVARDMWLTINSHDVIGPARRPGGGSLGGDAAAVCGTGRAGRDPAGGHCAAGSG